jgi:hypothetical protein
MRKASGAMMPLAVRHLSRSTPQKGSSSVKLIRLHHNENGAMRSEHVCKNSRSEVCRRTPACRSTAKWAAWSWGHLLRRFATKPIACNRTTRQEVSFRRGLQQIDGSCAGAFIVGTVFAPGQYDVPTASWTDVFPGRHFEVPATKTIGGVNGMVLVHRVSFALLGPGVPQ